MSKTKQAQQIIMGLFDRRKLIGLNDDIKPFFDRHRPDLRPYMTHAIWNLVTSGKIVRLEPKGTGGYTKG